MTLTTKNARRDARNELLKTRIRAQIKMLEGTYSSERTIARLQAKLNKMC